MLVDDVVTRSTNRIGMRCCAPSAATDPQLHVDSHVLDIGARSGDVQTGLWEQHADWSSDSADLPPSMSAERCSTADLLTPLLQPHHRCASQLALAAHSGAHQQDSRADIQSST